MMSLLIEMLVSATSSKVTVTVSRFIRDRSSGLVAIARAISIPMMELSALVTPICTYMRGREGGRQEEGERERKKRKGERAKD